MGKEESYDEAKRDYHEKGNYLRKHPDSKDARKDYDEAKKVYNKAGKDLRESRW